MNDKNTEIKSDQELLLGIKESSRIAFKALFYKYYTPLIGFCMYRVRDLDASKDLVQEIFTNLWIARERLDPEKSIKSYLYKSLINQIINSRKHSSSKTISLDESISEKAHTNNLGLENQIDVSSAIDKLPEKLKTVFLLSRVEGFKYSEIADICKISVKAVEKRMTNALKILRKLILE